MVAMFVIALSQILLVLSVSLESFWLMFIARLAFGAGFDVMSMSKSFLLNNWFFDSSLSFASNLSLAICRCVICMNGMTTPRLTLGYGISETLTFGFGLVLVSIIATFYVLALQDKTYKEPE